MSNIVNFNSTDFNLTVIKINNEPWFSGRHVATILGYKDSVNALKQHVRLKHKKKYSYEELIAILVENSKGGVLPPLKIPANGSILINESGLYSLILKSKLKKAEKINAILNYY